MLWGALDLTAAQAQTPSYGPTQIVSGGSSAAVASGVGVRRATLIFDRTGLDAGLDVATCHFDWLNITSGAPDDTWITSDYTGMETRIQTFVTAIQAYFPTTVKLTQIVWHRVGSGVSKPNPAERVLVLSTPISGSQSGSALAPQMACSLTFRTGVRKSWGRTYLPYSIPVSTASPYASNGNVDTIATAAHTMVTSSATADFNLVVVSKPLSSSLNVEQVEVDNVLDVIRRRRPDKSTYRKILP